MAAYTARHTVTLCILRDCWASTSGPHAWQQAVFSLEPSPLPWKRDSNPRCLHPSRPPPAPCDLCISQTQGSGHFPSMSAEGPAPPLPCLKSLTSYSSFSLAGMAKMAPVLLWQSWSDSPRRPVGVTGSAPSSAQTEPEAACPSSQHWEGGGKTVRSSKPAKATE